MIKKRKAIWDKSGGKCWYCGCELGEKGWHADHFHPIIRDLKIVTNGNRVTMTTDKTCAKPMFDVPENLVPSCAPCNNFKHSFSLEGYRSLIRDQFENTLKNSTGLRQLNRLGLVDMTEKPVVFWFEKQGIEMPTKGKLMGLEDYEGFEWKYDHVEKCEYVETPEGLMTLRRHENHWMAIHTKPDWEQERKEIFGYLDEAKLRALEWAING